MSPEQQAELEKSKVKAGKMFTTALSTGNPLAAATAGLNYLKLIATDFFTEGTPIKEREDAGAVGASLSAMGSAGVVPGSIGLKALGSAISVFTGNASQKEKEEYKKWEDATIESSPQLSREIWDSKSSYEQEQIVKEFIKVNDGVDMDTKILGFDIKEESHRGVIKKNDDEGTIAKKITDDILRNASSKTIYNISTQEPTNLSEDKHLADAIAKGNIRVVGEIDARSPFGGFDPALGNGYKIIATSDSGYIREYIISKSVGQRENPSPDMRDYAPPTRSNLYDSVTNEMYDYTVSNLASSFPIRGYQSEYTHPESGITVVGNRSSNGDKTLSIKDIKVAGESLSPAQFKKLTSGIIQKYPHIRIDDKSGELRGINEYELTQLLYSSIFN